MANEKRLIDANALYQKIKETYPLDFGEIITDPYWFADMVDDAPTVDAVEVVRCKECVSGHTQYYGNLIRCNVMGCGGLKPDDFCSYGERREGE